MKKWFIRLGLGKNDIAEEKSEFWNMYKWKTRKC